MKYYCKPQSEVQRLDDVGSIYFNIVVLQNKTCYEIADWNWQCRCFCQTERQCRRCGIDSWRWVYKQHAIFQTGWPWPLHYRCCYENRIWFVCDSHIISFFYPIFLQLSNFLEINGSWAGGGGVFRHGELESGHIFRVYFTWDRLKVWKPSDWNFYVVPNRVKMYIYPGAGVFRHNKI